MRHKTSYSVKNYKLICERLNYEMRYVGGIGGWRQSDIVGAGDWPLSQVAVTWPGATWAT